MNKQIWKNIIEPKKSRTIFGKVISRESATACLIEDELGHTYRVAVTEDAFYPKGVSVRVEDRRIVSTGCRAGKHKMIEV